MTEERDLILDAVDELCQGVIAPRAAEIDRTAEFPRDVYQALADQGLLAAFVPPAHGGVEIGLETLMLVVDLSGSGLFGSVAQRLFGMGGGAVVHVVSQPTESGAPA